MKTKRKKERKKESVYENQKKERKKERKKESVYENQKKERKKERKILEEKPLRDKLK